MATTFLTRTPGSAGNRQTWTISAWIKRGVMGTYQNIVCSRSDANNALHLAFDDEDRLFYQHYLGGSVLGELKTNRKFRDPSAWYNVVITFDSTNGTAGDRQKMFINGVEETVFDTDTNISQNQTSDWNDISNPMYIGQGGNSNNYWTGSMSYVAFIDGTAEAPTIFLSNFHLKIFLEFFLFTTIPFDQSCTYSTFINSISPILLSLTNFFAILTIG